MSDKKWFLVTNTENLKYYFDCNMIVERQAFPENTYLRDIQSKRPFGYVVISTHENLDEALDEAIAEDSNLVPCIAEIEVQSIESDEVYVRCSNGSYELTSTEKIDAIDVDELLIAAPLPLGIIRSIILSSAKNKIRCANEFSSLFGDFPQKYFTNNAKLFKTKKAYEKSAALGLELQESTLLPYTQEKVNCEDNIIDYKKSLAFGGALALAYYQTKNGRVSEELFRFLISDDDHRSDGNIHLASIKKWLSNASSSTDLDAFIKRVLDIASSESNFGTIQQDLLKAFDLKEDIPESYHIKVSGLAASLTQIVERTYGHNLDAAFSRLIEHYEKKEVGSSTLYLLISMVFIRDHIETALKFYHDDFTEEDYFLIAVFYGAFRGMNNVPPQIRKIINLNDWLSHQMVMSCHNSNGARVRFKGAPSMPLLLHEQFIKSTTKTDLQDRLQKLLVHLEIDEDEVLRWSMSTKDEYKVKAATLYFSKRPRLKVDIQHDKIEESFRVKTIRDAKDLFDFNRAFWILKG